MKFFGLAMTPLPPPFLEITLRFFTQNIPLWNQQNLQCNFLDRKWPPPPFGSFPKKHPFWRIQSPLIYIKHTIVGLIIITGIIIRPDKYGSSRWQGGWVAIEGTASILVGRPHRAGCFAPRNANSMMLMLKDLRAKRICSFPLSWSARISERLHRQGAGWLQLWHQSDD